MPLYDMSLKVKEEPEQTVKEQFVEIKSATGEHKLVPSTLVNAMFEGDHKLFLPFIGLPSMVRIAFV